MVEIFTMPLELPFFQRAMLASGLAALVCAVVGTFVVLKGLAFMGDAVAHSSLAGMSVAFLFGGNGFWGLQARADALMMKTATPLPSLQNVVPTLALV